MEYFNRIRSAVSTVTATVNSALPGNPVTREYDALHQVASAGPALSWKIYSGRKRSTKQSVAVWVFEKRDVERWPRREKDLFMEAIKRGVSQLTKLRHPRMLIVEHPLEESRESLAFCTEPVFSSLANVLGRVDNLSAIPQHLENFKLLDIEIRHGLFQISEALAFLHQDARILHRNVNPEAVLINEKGGWKLAAFDFAVANSAPPGTLVSYPSLDWDSELMPCVQPSLESVAPELVLGGRNDPAADIFSLGVLAFAVFNQGRPPFDHGNNLSQFKKNATELKVFPPNKLQIIPKDFRDDVKMCLNFTPDLRPDATQFSKIGYFDDPLVKTLNYLESLCQMDNVQKSQFFKGLPNVLGKFPTRVLIQKVFPYLSAECGTPDLVPFILPNIFQIAESASDPDFASVILPTLIPILKLQKPFQITLLLLQNMELLLNKTAESEVRTHFLPLIYNALDSDTAKVQELCLSIVPRIAKLVHRESMKTNLLPKLLKLTTSASTLSVKVNSLLCIGKLLETLEKWMVTDQILPILPKTNSKEPGVLMAVLGIYKLAFTSSKLGISREAVAKSCLPFLISVSVESTLNLAQFDAYMSLIRSMLDKVEEEQRYRLQQLSALQEEQRGGVQDFNQILSEATTKQQVPKELQGLDALNEMQNGPKEKSTGSPGKRPLSLEEKRRIAAEQEYNIRLRAQPSLHPTTAPTTGVQKKPQMDFGFNSLLTSPASITNSFTSFASPPTAPPRALIASPPAPPQPLITSPPRLPAPPLAASPIWTAPPRNATPARPSAAGNVDLSAFDSLLSFPSSKPQQAMKPVQNPTSSAPKKKSAGGHLDDLLG